MTIPSVTPGPDNPDPATDSPSLFSTKAAAFVLWWKNFALELVATIAAMNTAVGQVNEDAAQVAADTAAAQLAATNATNAANTNGTSATSMAIQTALPASITFITQAGKNWQVNQFVQVGSIASVGNWMLGQITAYNSATGSMTVTVKHSQGTGTYASWNVTLAPPIVITTSNSVVPKSAAFTAYDVDKGRVYVATGTWALALDAAATLGDGWYIYVKSVPGGAITVDPTGAETIDDAATAVVSGGASALIMCDGTKFTTIRFSAEAGLLKVSDRKAAGTMGGSSVGSDITQTRVLNTVEMNTITGASLASNVITLPAGTYEVAGRAPSLAGAHQAFLYNSTDASYVLLGSSSSVSGGTISTDSMFSGFFTITASKNFTVRHFTASAIATSGLGVNNGSGQLHVYTEVLIKKVA